MATAETTFPVDTILKKYNQQIQNYVEIVSLGKALITSHKEVFPFAVFTDITSTVRSNADNVERLLQVVKTRGLPGFVKFVSTLLNDKLSNHVTLGRLLLNEVQQVFQDGNFPDEERALILPLLNTVDPVKFPFSSSPASSLGAGADEEDLPKRAKAVRRVLAAHTQKVSQEIQLAGLRLLLLKHAVLSQEEYEQLTELPPEQRNEELIKRISRKSDSTVAAFYRCLKESPKHAKLAELFEQEMAKPEEEEEDLGPSTEDSGPIEPPSNTKTDKMAVFLCMDEYIRLAEDSKVVDFSLLSINPRYKESRTRLKSCLEECGFNLVDLGSLFAKKEAVSEEARSRKQLLQDLFKKYVEGGCKENATVFIYVTGLVYPVEKRNQDSSKQLLSEKVYQGAILLQGAPEICRREEESLYAHDLSQWVELLPTPFITMLFDCHASHISQYARQQKQKESYILEFPWLELTRWNTRTVVYGLSPDKQAILYIPPEAVDPKHPFGLLTEKFVKVFESWIHRGKPASSTHRLMYEQISYHWNGRRRAHLQFTPSIQGDVDMVFLGVDGYPYRQWLRADLTSNKSPPSPRERFDLTRVHVRTSKMAGLILDDVLDVFHICRPEEVFRGKVKEAHQMYAIVEIENVEDLKTLLEEEYRDLAPLSDSSMDFLCLRKSFPLHLKQDYTVHLDLDEEDSLKIKDQIGNNPPLLSVVNSSKGAKITVKKEGHSYTIEDNCGDVTYRPKVKNLVHVASLLEMMAWYKHVKAICPSQLQVSPFHSCFLTYNSDRVLLQNELNFGVTVGMSSESDSYDSNTYASMNLGSNHVITGLETRAKSTSDGSNFPVKDIQVLYRKILHSNIFKYEGKPLEFPTDVMTQSITIQLVGASKKSEVCIRLLSKHAGMLTFKGKMEEVKCVWQPGTDLEFDFELETASNIAKMELKGLTKDQKVKITLHSKYLMVRQNLKLSSAWPRRHPFDTPIVASVVQLSLVNPMYPSNPSPPATTISMQVQLYGVKEGATLEVEEKEQLTVHFANENDDPVFVYFLCLEETGMVQYLFSEFVSSKTSMKKFISTSFPQRHNVPAITDTYKVFVCPKMMYLEPYIQRGLHQYFSPLHYDVCSYGARSVDRSDRWDQYEFKVTIRKAIR